MESVNDNLSIKKLLFTKAIPNNVLPAMADQCTIYGCSDCGDKFIIESNYEQHINRKSIKISYTCRNYNCSDVKVFYNRCNLLAHIRSHNFKTATINISDLKIEPLPITELNMNQLTENNASTSEMQDTYGNVTGVSCHECNETLHGNGKSAAQTLANHYMQSKETDVVYTCPVCIFALPSICALKSHLRIHLKYPPYICPECGLKLDQRSANYPYSHGCEGTKMMRVTARVRCPMPDCYSCHPNELIPHIKRNHLKKVFKCPFCFVACFNEAIMVKHMKAHTTVSKPFIFYQCEMCPGRLVLQDTLDNHLKGHEGTTKTFPCWACGTIFQDAASLVKHHTLTHDANLIITKALSEINKGDSVNKPNTKQAKRIYRVIKKCDQCKSSFKYRCSFEQIKMLPNECPAKCTSNALESYKQLICGMCKNEMRLNWEDIKKHFAMFHKNHRCVDLNVLVKPFDMKRYKTNLKKQKRIGAKRSASQKNKNIKRNVADQTANDSESARDKENGCHKCGQIYDTKKELEIHLVTHRDPCMAYQCMECGQCFVVKPTFSKHLLLEHEISDVELYITNKNCYNETALMKYQSDSVKNDEPLRENQCKICRQQFDDGSDLEKHFRVHGMAFLMKKTITSKNNSP